MLALLWLVPAFPLLGFVALSVIGGRLSRRTLALLGVGSVGCAAVVAGLVTFGFVMSGSPGHAYTQTLWTWLDVTGFAPTIGLYVDALSIVMMLVITIVGFLIHLYSVEFMIDDEGYRRFFVYMNLFVASMVTLVLADNLLFLYLGWEGVGLCSYLLIGHWYTNSANGQAAQKAFIVTRLGDVSFTIGLLLLFVHLGTLNIQELMQRASEQWMVGSGLAIAAAALLLGGAVGKSAQLPLQVWLPDAMAGPSPVSALIHAATMVTAGVYLIARTHVLYAMAPSVQTAVGIIGALTLLMAACSALVQRDFKRVLAYSTISQIGYMFLALGVGAWTAAIFHFMTHAFFKALLFLSAGAVILSLNDEHDIYKMGGLRTELPICFWTFLVGSASLAGFPLMTAGFYSKEAILMDTWASAMGSGWLWAAGSVGALLTAIYSFRLVFVVFFGENKTEVGRKPGLLMHLPLVILAGASLVAGYVELPKVLGHGQLFSRFVGTALPPMTLGELSTGTEWRLLSVAMVVSLFGIVLAYVFFRVRPSLSTALTETVWGAALSRLWLRGWGFDDFYARLIQTPFLWLAKANEDDGLNSIYEGLARFSRLVYEALHRMQTGQLRWYATVLAAGSIVMLGMAVFL